MAGKKDEVDGDKFLKMNFIDSRVGKKVEKFEAGEMAYCEDMERYVKIAKFVKATKMYEARVLRPSNESKDDPE